MFGFPAEEPLPIDRFLMDEEQFDIGSLRGRSDPAYPWSYTGILLLFA